MSAHDDYPITPETKFPPEQPCSFRIGEVITQPGLIAEDGSFKYEIHHGKETRKRVVMDAYWPDDGDSRETVITCMLDKDESSVTMMGSTDRVDQMASFGEFISPRKLAEMVLQFKVGGTEALFSENARVRGKAKLYLLDIAEQYVSDRIARSEDVSEAQQELYNARRQREEEKGKYAMHDDDFFYTPEELADIETDKLFECLES